MIYSFKVRKKFILFSTEFKVIMRNVVEEFSEEILFNFFSLTLNLLHHVFLVYSIQLLREVVPKGTDDGLSQYSLGQLMDHIDLVVAILSLSGDWSDGIDEFNFLWRLLFINLSGGSGPTWFLGLGLGFFYLFSIFAFCWRLLSDERDSDSNNGTKRWRIWQVGIWRQLWVFDITFLLVFWLFFNLTIFFYGLSIFWWLRLLEGRNLEINLVDPTIQLLSS